MTLVASSSEDLQSMLDITSKYAHKWQYTFNTRKSKVMIFGESASSRKALRASRIWSMNGYSISETDSISHLGITISLSGSSLNHTLKSIASARSAFYSLQSAGPRFGCLHPITALKLFKAVPLSILRFGLEVIFPTKSEILMLERCQLAILKSIVGLPTRSSNAAVHFLLGTLPMRLLIIKAHLSLLFRILTLPDSATAKAILLARYETSSSNCYSRRIGMILQELDLPFVKDLLSSFPTKLAWKAHVRATLLILVDEQLKQAALNMHSLNYVVNLHSKLNGKPLPIIASFKGDIMLTRLNNFRIRLLLHCSILNGDTSAFHARPDRVRDPICPVCNAALEDAYHFVAVCPPLQHIRDRWLPRLQISSGALFDHMMCTPWIYDSQLQQNIVRFLSELRAARSSILCN